MKLCYVLALKVLNGLGVELLELAAGLELGPVDELGEDGGGLVPQPPGVEVAQLREELGQLLVGGVLGALVLQVLGRVSHVLILRGNLVVCRRKF